MTALARHALAAWPCVHCGALAARCPRGCGTMVCDDCGPDHAEQACPKPALPERHQGHEDFAPTDDDGPDDAGF